MNHDLAIEKNEIQSSLENEREENIKKVDQMNREKADLSATITILQVEVDSLSSSKSEMMGNVNNLENRLKEMSLALESAELKISTLSKLNEVLELEKSVLDEHCLELQQAADNQAEVIAASNVKIEDLERALDTAMSGAEHIEELSVLHEQEKADLEAKFGQQAAKIEKMEEALAMAEAQTIQLRADVVTLESQNLILSKKCELLEANLGIKDATHEELLNKHAKLSQELENKECALRVNLETQATLQSRIRDIENQHLIAMKEKEELDFKVEELMAHTLELEDSATASAAAIAAKSAENQSLRTEINEKDEALLRAKEENESLAIIIAKQEGTIHALEDAMASFRVEQREVLEQLADLKAKYSAQEVLIQEKYNALSKSDQEIIELHEANTLLEGQVSHLMEDVAEQEKTVESLDSEIAKLRSENEEQATKIILLIGEKDVDVAAANTQRDIFREKLESQLKETNEIMVKVIALEKDNKELREAKEGLERRLLELEKKTFDLESNLKDKEAALASTTVANIKKRFSSNTSDFRQKMNTGINGKVFTMAFPPTECVVTIKEPSLLCFSQTATGWSLVSMFSTSGYEISPISVCDITEIHPGLTPEAIAMFPSIGEKERASNLFLTIVFKPSMTYAIAVQSADDRSALLNGLRALIAEVELELNSVPEHFLSSTGGVVPDEISVAEKNSRLSMQVSLFTSQIKINLLGTHSY